MLSLAEAIEKNGAHECAERLRAATAESNECFKGELQAYNADRTERRPQAVTQHCRQVERPLSHGRSMTEGRGLGNWLQVG